MGHQSPRFSFLPDLSPGRTHPPPTRRLGSDPSPPWPGRAYSLRRRGVFSAESAPPRVRDSWKKACGGGRPSPTERRSRGPSPRASALHNGSAVAARPRARATRKNPPPERSRRGASGPLAPALGFQDGPRPGRAGRPRQAGPPTRTWRRLAAGPGFVRAEFSTRTSVKLLCVCVCQRSYCEKFSEFSLRTSQSRP